MIRLALHSPASLRTAETNNHLAQGPGTAVLKIAELPRERTLSQWRPAFCVL